MALFNDGYEDVRLERWAPGVTVDLDAAGGLEVLVLSGGFREGGEDFVEHSWLRLPKGGHSQAVSGETGARVWIKSGHLAREPRPPQV